jgi:hypothetical protein
VNGLFRQAQNIEDHEMHSESFSLEKEACDLINMAKAVGNRILWRCLLFRKGLNEIASCIADMYFKIHE